MNNLFTDIEGSSIELKRLLYSDNGAINAGAISTRRSD
jgi:hypothetical protein